MSWLAKARSEDISRRWISVSEEGDAAVSLGSEHYVPCLRWKQGEYQALLRLSPGTKDSLTPLIEVPEIGFDFETRRESRSVDEHLSAFAKRLKAKWRGRRCFVDMHVIDLSKRMETGQHPFAFVFDDLGSEGALAIPVIDLKQDSECRNAVRAIAAMGKRGVCARIGIEEAAKSNIKASLETLIQQCDVGVDQCDFILDMGAPNFEPIEDFAGLLETLIGGLPHLNEWRSLAVIGTSFPGSMAEVRLGTSTHLRNEWRLYKLLVRRLRASGVRIPTFGDYGISYPEVLAIDWRHVKPFASVRYTIDDRWLIVKGPNVRDYGFGQYRELCRAVVNSGYYSGETFSSGDRYIRNCAQGTASTGTLTTWRWVGTNHHLEKVARDVASLPVS